jgi:hypothetical protein
MSAHYTDVDKLILDRWQEVRDLQDSFDQLLKRMQEVVDGTLGRASRWLDEQGWKSEYDLKFPIIKAWKPAWEVRKEPVVHVGISDFAPFGFGRVHTDHPCLWLYTSELARLKMKEPQRVQFARELRTALGPAADAWDNDDVSDADEPLGRYCVDVSDAGRVELVAQPQKLLEFIQSGFTALFDLAPLVDQALARLRQ